MTIKWPGGKAFAFTVFDDPDSQTVGGMRSVYDYLSDAGLRTTAGRSGHAAPLATEILPAKRALMLNMRNTFKNCSDAGSNRLSQHNRAFLLSERNR